MDWEKQDFEMYQGESKSLIINITERDSGEPVDLSEVDDIIWIVKKPMVHRGDTIRKSLKDGDIKIIEPENGEILIPLKKSDTDIIFGLYHHYAWIVDVVGNESVFLKGMVNIKKR